MMAHVPLNQTSNWPNYGNAQLDNATLSGVHFCSSDNNNNIDNDE